MKKAVAVCFVLLFLFCAFALANFGYVQKVYGTGITRVQGNARTEGTDRYETVTLSSTPTSGNVLVLAVGTLGDYTYIEVTDMSQTGVTWTRQVYKNYVYDYFPGFRVEIWLGVVGSGASKDVLVTLTGGTSIADAILDVCEYSGVATSNFLDQTATNGGYSKYPDTGTTDTTTQANELWIGCTFGSESAQSSPTNGFTLLDGTYVEVSSLAFLEKIVSSTGEANSGTTFGQNTWVGCIATFKPTPTNNAPTNDALTLDLTGASYKGTKTLLPQKQEYKFVYNCSDTDGVTTISYAEIRLDYSSKNVILRATRVTNDEWSFAEQSDPSNYVTLGTCSHSTSGTQKTFNFYVKINWAWGDSLETIGVRCYVTDGTDSDQDDYSNIFGVEAHLNASSLIVNDYRVNPSQTLTFTGYWKYNGTTIVPPDGDYQVKIKLSGTQKGSTDTTLVSGAFSINDVTAETTVNSYSYTVEASYNSSAGSFSAVIVDKAVITITANTTSPAPSADVNFTLTAIYDYDDSPITSWTVNTYRNSTHFASGNFTDGGYTDLYYVYTVENITESAYDLTAFTSNTVTVYWSTYVALTIKTLDLDSNVLTEAIVYFNSTQITVDSNGYATKTGIEKNENITVKVYWHGIKVNGTWTTNMTETKTIEASCNVWSITVNARDADGTVLSLSPSKFVWNFPNGTQINTTKSDGSWIFKIMNGTHYYKIYYQGQWISENVTLPVDNKNVTVINKNCWAYRLTVYVTNQNGVEMSGATLTLTRSDNASLADYGLTPKTVDYYNTTHGRYVWTQLTNQTSSYTIKATSGSDSKTETTALTANTQKTIVITTTISGGPGGPSGGPSFPPVQQPTPYVPPTELPKVPGVEFEYGIIVLVGVVGVATTVAVFGRGKPSLETRWKNKTKYHSSSGKWPKPKTRNLSKKWRRKRS